jgi:hypothetical protein
MTKETDDTLCLGRLEEPGSKNTTLHDRLFTLTFPDICMADLSGRTVKSFVGLTESPESCHLESKNLALRTR